MLYKLLYKHSQAHLHKGKVTMATHHYKLALSHILGNMNAGQILLSTSIISTTLPEIRFPTEQREAAVAR